MKNIASVVVVTRRINFRLPPSIYNTVYNNNNNNPSADATAVSLDVGHTIVKTVRNNAPGSPERLDASVSMSHGGVIELDPGSETTTV